MSTYRSVGICPRHPFGAFGAQAQDCVRLLTDDRTVGVDSFQTGVENT